MSVLLTACTQGPTDDPALDAQMRIQGAQFVAGKPPAASGGPAAEAIDVTTTIIWPGFANKLVKGTLGEGALTAAIDLVGDEGYWLVLAGAPDVSRRRLCRRSARSRHFRRRFRPATTRSRSAPWTPKGASARR